MLGEGADKMVSLAFSSAGPLMRKQAEVGTSDLSEELMASKKSNPKWLRKIFEGILSASGDSKSPDDEDEDDSEENKESSSSLIDKLQSFRKAVHADGSAVHAA